MSNSGDLQQSEDLFHDVVLKLILKIRKNEITAEKDINGYLFIMAKNEWISRARREKKMYISSEVSDFEQSGTTEIDLEKKEKRDLMEEMLSSLGEMCKNLLKLTFYLDYTLAEAAEKLDISNASVAKTYQYRCKKKLFDAVRNNQAFKEIMQL